MMIPRCKNCGQAAVPIIAGACLACRDDGVPPIDFIDALAVAIIAAPHWSNPISPALPPIPAQCPICLTAITFINGRFNPPVADLEVDGEWVVGCESHMNERVH